MTKLKIEIGGNDEFGGGGSKFFKILADTVGLSIDLVCNEQQ